MSLPIFLLEEYKRHEYILEHQELKHEKERYLKILKEQGEEGDYIDSLYFLSDCLEKYHNKMEEKYQTKVYTSVLKGDVEVFQTEINRLLRKTIRFK